MIDAEQMSEPLEGVEDPHDSDQIAAELDLMGRPELAEHVRAQADTMERLTVAGQSALQILQRFAEDTYWRTNDNRRAVDMSNAIRDLRAALSGEGE